MTVVLLETTTVFRMDPTPLEGGRKRGSQRLQNVCASQSLVVVQEPFLQLVLEELLRICRSFGLSARIGRLSCFLVHITPVQTMLRNSFHLASKNWFHTEYH